MSTAAYGWGTATATADGTLIDSGEGPGGLWYSADLDPAKTYRVTVHGAPRATPFVWRHSVDDHSPVWEAAPTGIAVLRVTDTARLDMLIYRDSPGTYLVRAVTVEECGDACPGDPELRDQILAELPELDGLLAGTDDYKAARLLLGWVAPRVAWTGSDRAMGGPAPLDTAALSAAEIYYDYFVPEAAGVFCSGAAEFFSKVLDLFTIQHFRLEYGDVRNDLTHAAVVVTRTAASGRTEWLALDPTFNADYTRRDTGRPLSLDTMLELWRNGMGGRINAREGSLATRSVIFTQADGDVEAVPCGEISSFSACSLRSYLEAWRDQFLATGYEEGIEGFVQILGTGTLFRTAELAVPERFLAMHAVFRDAVTNRRSDVQVAPIPPILQASPLIAGGVEAGQELRAVGGQWAGRPIAWHTQWARCDLAGFTCRAIAGGDAALTLTDDDVGHVLRVTVVGENEEGLSDPVVLFTPAAVRPRPAQAPEPKPDLAGSRSDAPGVIKDTPVEEHVPPRRVVELHSVAREEFATRLRVAAATARIRSYPASWVAARLQALLHRWRAIATMAEARRHRAGVVVARGLRE
ncbi:MAG: hypothetical protein ABR583_06800 [Gaiellaceae bacterium]